MWWLPGRNPHFSWELSPYVKSSKNQKKKVELTDALSQPYSTPFWTSPVKSWTNVWILFKLFERIETLGLITLVLPLETNITLESQLESPLGGLPLMRTVCWRKDFITIATTIIIIIIIDKQSFYLFLFLTPEMTAMFNVCLFFHTGDPMLTPGFLAWTMSAPGVFSPPCNIKAFRENSIHPLNCPQQPHLT